MARYSKEQRIAALALLATNSGNIEKTSHATGISRDTLRKWRDSDDNKSPEVATIKNDFEKSYRDKLKQAKEAALTRMLELMPNENDLHKVTGAAKVLAEISITQEVADDLRRETEPVASADQSFTQDAQQAAAGAPFN